MPIERQLGDNARPIEQASDPVVLLVDILPCRLRIDTTRGRTPTEIHHDGSLGMPEGNSCNLGTKYQERAG
jgi:hypothetical protein